MSDAQQEYVAPTYLLTSIPDFVDSVTYRMLADGMLLQDIRAAREEVADWSGWCEFWLARARTHEEHGDGALARGYRRTAGEHFVRAALCAHYSQFLVFHDLDVKRRGWEAKAALYRRAAPILDPPAERVEIQHRDSFLPGYLRAPATGRPLACVVQIGGLDAHKEDAHQFSELCLARGLATFAFDGPGQGETFWNGMSLDAGYHEAVSAVIDHLESREEVDSRRIGVIGRSTGGFLAPQAAAVDGRVRACVAWGAMYDLKEFDSGPPLIKDGFRMVTRARDWDETRERVSFIDLDGVAKRIACPLYVLHGGKDNITPPYNAERMIADASGPTLLRLYPDSIHCNHDVAHIARPEMADWLTEQLEDRRHDRSEIRRPDTRRGGAREP